MTRLAPVARDRWLVGVVAGAALVRAALMAVVRPADLDWVDAPRYARIGWTGFFEDFWAPAGYPAFLAVVRTVWRELAFTTFVQHALGCVTVVLLVLAADRLGVRRPHSLLPGAAVAFSADFAYLEHILMNESLFLLLLASAAFAAAQWCAGNAPGWLAATSGLVVAAALVRSTALAALPVVALVAVVSAAGVRRRLASLALATIPGVVLLGVYLLAASGGTHAGLNDMGGWHLYARTAPFADCEEISVDDDDPSLAPLCESTPAGERSGPYHYEWEAASPAVTLWGIDPARDDDLRRFATAVIRAQPMDYLEAVARDVVRLVDPDYDRTPGHGQPVDVLDVDFRQPDVEAAVADLLDAEYDGVRERTTSGVGVLAAYQRATRLPGLLTVVALAGAALGLLRARGARRRAIALVGGMGVVVLAVPILLFTWDFRYTLPALPLVYLAGVLGWAPAGRAGEPDGSDQAVVDGLDDPRHDDVEHLVERRRALEPEHVSGLPH